MIMGKIKGKRREREKKTKKSVGTDQVTHIKKNEGNQADI